jgi:hypothetical protein
MGKVLVLVGMLLVFAVLSFVFLFVACHECSPFRASLVCERSQQSAFELR